MPSIAEQYDVSPQERRNIEDRAKLRAEMRQQFLKLYQNPHRLATGEGGYAFDPVLQRWLSMRAQQYHYFKPTLKTIWAPLVIFGAIFVQYRLIKWDRETREAQLRRGEVSYRDRKWKFI